MKRAFYSETIETFLKTNTAEIIGRLELSMTFAHEHTQTFAWAEQIEILKNSLRGKTGKLYLEYEIPRMGKRIDAILIIQSVIFVLEFKVGAKEFLQKDIDQVWDYALDLKNFHEGSHNSYVAPVLIATGAKDRMAYISMSSSDDKLLHPIHSNAAMLELIIEKVLDFCSDDLINPEQWEAGRYQPTPTIVEAAMALYAGHSVEEISRSDASAINLKETSDQISEIISFSRKNSLKSICFVTGVPGAGKTLVGLNIATKYFDKDNDLYSVFLSGNGPLVAVLREALARDRVRTKREQGERIRLGDARREVKLFIQNVHNFRDECLIDFSKPPLEHVALFDEAQRAWDLTQTANFMKRKKNRPGFLQSEPDFLISCMDRHSDWAVIICLVGGGQEINTGEAGISEWIEALRKNYAHWNIYVSPHLTDSEYDAGKALEKIDGLKNVNYSESLHLSVSMRSFRSEKISLLVKQILDLEPNSAKDTLKAIDGKYPIVITRDLKKAKQWLKSKARGSERYGLLVSSAAVRLKPLAIDIRADIDPIHWFLDNKEDTRSSYYLEDAATEFQVQGLELDWSCVVWDGDFRLTDGKWDYRSFVGSTWNRIHKPERQMYLKNAYRVLLTRARQGMVIVVPEGDKEDPTRKAVYYDSVFEYLQDIGFEII